MNRIPKYKVWDKKLKQMAQVAEMNFRGDVFTHFRAFYIGPDGDECVLGGNPYKKVGSEYRFYFLQFIGLPDKAGTPIYEGHILHDNINGRTYFIVWADDEARFELEDVRDHSLRHIKDVKVCERIGNIYENPELLKNN